MELSSSTVSPSQLSNYQEGIAEEQIIRGTSHTAKKLRTSSPSSAPLFSVVMRTQGERIPLMEQALLCLTAQDCQDFELIITIHNSEKSNSEKVLALVDTFGDLLSSRTSVLQIDGGLRGVPLNEGIDVSSGEYVVFFDDDDLVFAHWLNEFARVGKENPGKIIRSRCADRFVEYVDNERVPSYVISGLNDVRAPKFSLTEHFFISQTVLHSYATPRQNIIEAKTYFDESYPIVEDWDFLLRNAELWGVVDTNSITAVYNRWTNSTSSLHTYDRQTWIEMHNKVFTRFDRRGILVGGGELKSLYKMWLEHEKFKDFAGDLMQEGDLLTLRKKYNAQVRSVQYKAYENIESITSRKQALKQCIRILLPNSLKPILRKIFR